MAEHPELWTERTPEPRPEQAPDPAPERLPERSLFDRRAAFGVAREAERLPEAPPPLEPRRRIRPERPHRERGPFLTYLQAPWSYGDVEPGDRWHRVLCRLGRHEMGGGHTLQLDSELVFVERRCRRCGAEARAGAGAP